jgi:cytochrome c oxidase subunit 4
MSYFLTWIALMILLALTFASSYIPLGPWNTAINLGISCAKALLIALFFMHLRGAGTLLRAAALIGLIWLALLFGISATDYATREVSPAPWTAPR